MADDSVPEGLKPKGGRPKMYPNIDEFRALKDEVRVLREAVASIPVSTMAATSGAVFTSGTAVGETTRDRVWKMLCGMANSLGYEAFNDRMFLQLLNNIGRMEAACDFITDNLTRLSEEQRAVMDRKGVFTGTYTNGKTAPMSNSRPAEQPRTPQPPALVPPESKPMIDLGMR